MDNKTTPINVIIPAAGEATRLRPITSNISKAMVPVNGKPVIDYIIEYLNQYNIEQIVIVIGKNDDLRNYINAKYGNDERISYITQFKPTGPLDAIEIGSKELRNHLPTVVWLGDTIIGQEKLQLGDDFVLCAKEVEDQSEWCIYSPTSKRHYYNKPKTNIENGYALVGIYSFSNGRAFSLASAITSKQNSIGEISDLLVYYQNNATSDWKMPYIITNEWYDMGNFRTYHETSAKLLTQKARGFNKISVDTFYGTLTKTSEETEILRPEIQWYTKLNANQKLFVPTIIDSGIIKNDLAYIKMTLETGVLLSDLLVYDNLPITTWDYLLDKIFRIMHEVFYTEDTTNLIKLKEMYIQKTVDRLETFRFSRSIYDKLLLLGDMSCDNPKWSSIIHGDLHTGNIIFEPISGKMKLIDPRGSFGGKQPCTEGDQYYDMFKLAHDLYWGYNHMLAGLEHNRSDIKDLFCKYLVQYGYNVEKVTQGGLLLLATCIPLHNDHPERQERFLKVVKDNLK